MQGDTTEGIKALSQGVDFDGLRSPFCAQVILNLIITIIVNRIGNAIVKNALYMIASMYIIVLKKILMKQNQIENIKYCYMKLG